MPVKNRITKAKVFSRFEAQHVKKYGDLDSFKEKEFSRKAAAAAALITKDNRPDEAKFFKSKDYKNSQRRAKRQHQKDLQEEYKSKDVFTIIASDIPVFGCSIPQVRQANLKRAEKKILGVEKEIDDGAKSIIYIIKTKEETKYFEDDRFAMMSSYRGFVRQYYSDSNNICLATISQSEDKNNIFMLINLEVSEKANYISKQ